MRTIEECEAVLSELGFNAVGSISTPGGTISRIAGNRFVASGMSTRHKWARNDERVTVGKRTVCIYRVRDRRPHGFQNFSLTELTSETLKKAVDQCEKGDA